MRHRWILIPSQRGDGDLQRRPFAHRGVGLVDLEVAPQRREQGPKELGAQILQHAKGLGGLPNASFLRGSDGDQKDQK